MKKKMFALILAAVMAVSVFASCEANLQEVEEIVTVADTALKGSVYTATATTTFETASPALSEKIADMEQAGITYSVSGDDFTAQMSVSIGDTKVKKTYIVKDGVLYNESTADIQGTQTTIQKKATLDEGQISSILAEIGADATLDYKDFENYDRKGSASKCTITCTNAKEEALTGSDEILGAALREAGLELTLTDATLEIKIQDGKYQSVALTYHYIIRTMDGEFYNMSATLTTTYDYESEVSISSPTDADAYHFVTYENALK